MMSLSNSNGDKYNTTSADSDFVVSKNARRFDDIPGPSKFQLIRGFIPGGKYHGSSFKEFGNLLRKEFGDLFKIGGGFGVPSIVMSFNPDHFEKVFKTEGTCPFRRPSASVSYFRENVRKDFYKDMMGLTVSNNDEWKRTRDAVNPILVNPSNINVFFPKLLNINHEFVERIKETRDSCTLEAPDDFILEIKRWTFESIVAVALDKEFNLLRKNRDNPEVVQLFKNISRTSELSYDLDLKPPVWKYFETPSSREMMTILDQIQSTFEKLVNEAIQDMETSKNKEEQSVLQKLCSIDRKLASVVVMDMLSSGLDTTSTVFSGVLLTIGTNLDKQDLLRQEIMDILPTKDTTLTAEHLENMSYLKACIKESIRMYPAGAGTSRRTTQDIELDGFRVPKGVDVVINNEVLMRDPKYYSNPDKFIPERWLDEECGATKTKHPFVYIPFGYGPRLCVGKKISDIILEIGLIEILRNFTVEYDYPPAEVFTSFLLNTPKAPLRFKFTELK